MERARNGRRASSAGRANRRGDGERAAYLWFGAALSVVVLTVTFVAVSSSRAELTVGIPGRAFAADRTTESSQPSSDRTNCAEIGKSDLRSPAEGIWVEANCALAASEHPLAPTTNCNRTSLDSRGFAEVSPGLYVFRQDRAAQAYLWYSSAEACFDLVSSRVVTAVCVDRVVTFNWSAGACSGHGGVLVGVNGR